MKTTDPGFDPYLRLEDSSGKELAFDDDGGGFPNAKLIFKAPKDDTYKIIATTFAPATGNYTLTVAPASAKQEKLQQVKDEFQNLMKKLQGEFATATTADAKKQVQERYFEALAGYAAN